MIENGLDEDTEFSSLTLKSIMKVKAYIEEYIQKFVDEVEVSDFDSCVFLWISKTNVKEKFGIDGNIFCCKIQEKSETDNAQNKAVAEPAAEANEQQPEQYDQ